jgi:uncharacterized protein (TIGR03435 family)
MSIRNTLLTIVVALAAVRSDAQQAVAIPCHAPASVAFDVASIKPSDRPSGSSSIRTQPDSITAGGTVFSMIRFACDLRDFQITGGPGWLRSSTWEIAAKLDQPPADWASLSNEVRGSIQRQRFQALLAQRFNFKWHFETKEMPVYNLVLSKNGSKLKSTPSDAVIKGSMSSNGNRGKQVIEAKGVAMNIVAASLGQSIGRTVIDKTGLTGIYDFTLNYTSDNNDATASSDDSASGPTIFTALEEQLGLKLEAAKGPVQVLVVDSIEKPSDN